MKQMNLSLVREINQTHHLEFTVVLTDYLDNMQRLDFVNRISDDVKLIPVIGRPLDIQYYLLGMIKHQLCLPF